MEIPETVSVTEKSVYDKVSVTVVSTPFTRPTLGTVKVAHGAARPTICRHAAMSEIRKTTKGTANARAGCGVAIFC